MVRARLKTLIALVCLPFLAILGRLASLQLVPETRDGYRRLAEHRAHTFLPPRRGRILARDGTVLAGNKRIYQLHFSYALLNPRDEPLAILADELRKWVQFPAKEDIERRLIELGDPLSLAASADAGDDEADGPLAASPPRSWLLLVEGVDEAAAAALKRRWARRPGPALFEVRPSGGASFAVWFHAARALQMEVTLERLRELLERAGAPPPRDLGVRVAAVLKQIEARVEGEVKGDRKEGIPPERVERKGRDVRRYYREQSWLLAQDVPLAAVTEIEYRPSRFPGIECVDAERREYPLKEACGTLTGFLRRLDSSEEEEKDLEARGHLLDSPSSFATIEDFQAARVGGARRTDLIGTTGIEELHDPDLRGFHGLRISRCDRRGRPTEVYDELPPVDGKDVRTTIDPALQRLLYEALEQAVRPSGGPRGGTAGSAAVMEVETGALLASVGFPGIDPGRLRDPGYEQKLKDDWGAQTQGWLIDRPAGLPLCPGSVFKIVVAAAAMESAHPWQGEFTPERRYPCNHKFALIPSLACDSLNGHTPTRSVNLTEALQFSCNNYFYYAGLQHLGADLLCPWAINFGYGRDPGIDLPGLKARAGRLTAADKAQLPWQACHYAIGQGLVEATPLQVLRSYAAIAVGGKCVPRPYLVRPSPPDPLLLRNPRTIEVIREGLWRAGHAPEGTASRAEQGLSGFNAAYKTGTAEVKTPDGTLNHGWVAGFAPFDKPRIAFVAVIEKTSLHGAEAAGPIIAKLLSYFAGKEPELYRAGPSGARLEGKS